MKLKVLHIIKSLGRGGAEMLLQETLKYHNKDEFEFHYIYFLPWKNQMVAGIENEGGIVINIPASNNIKLMLQASKVIHYIKKNNIDLIHCHLPWAGFLGRYVHWHTGIPVIYTEHNKQERYHWVTKLLNKWSFNLQSTVIAVSDEVAASIQKNIHPTIPVRTILNGVDINKFKRSSIDQKQIREQYGIGEQDILIGTIAVFRFQKRLKEWVDLFKVVYQKYPNVSGCIIGDGPLNEELRNYVKEQGLEKIILMPGLQTNVMPWLSAIDIFLMTSSFEGLPIALLEAMSMECAVVSTNAGGVGEVIRHEVDGFLMPVNEWQQLSQPLGLLIKEPDTIKLWGQKARARVMDAFNIQFMVSQLQQLYSGKIKNK